jgi:hypothetical protein
MLLSFVHVLLLCPCFASLSIKMCCFLTCCFVTMSIRNYKCLNVLTCNLSHLVNIGVKYIV